MEELFAIRNVHELYEGNEIIVLLCLMILAFYPLFLIVNKLILPGLTKVAERRGERYSRILERNNVSSATFYLFTSIYLLIWGDIFDNTSIMTPYMVKIKDKTVAIIIILAVTSFLTTMLNVGRDYYKVRAASKKSPIDLHVQIAKIFFATCAVLAVFSLVLGISISKVFASIGAAAALLTFVFKDTVLGLLASLQLTFQGIIHVGDWVTLPQYNADGDIEKITITVVIIKNFDGTHTTVPTYAFLTTGVKNWRVMYEDGGRRIKRALSIDMDSIKLCDQKLLNKLKKVPSFEALVKNKSKLFDVKNGVTNISIFRNYIEEYLRKHSGIHKEGFSFLIRQLDPTPTGMPIEVYVFAKDTKWSNYEVIQAEIFEHLLGVLPEFELRVFQNLSKIEAK